MKLHLGAGFELGWRRKRRSEAIQGVLMLQMDGGRRRGRLASFEQQHRDWRGTAHSFSVDECREEGEVDELHAGAETLLLCSRVHAPGGWGWFTRTRIRPGNGQVSEVGKAQAEARGKEGKGEWEAASSE